MYFSQFMDRLALDNDLQKEVEGTTAYVHMVLPLGTNCTVVYPEIDYQSRSRVYAGHFALPIDRHGRDRFVAKMLQFNRNAISVLDVGFMPAPKDDRLYTITWQVPKKEQPYANWHSDLISFENLATTGANEIKRMIGEWVKNCTH